MGIVHELEPITLVGGGVVEPGTLREAMTYGAEVVAADGGALACLANGVMPKAVIGDMDSSSDLEAQGIPAENLHFIGEQNSTDFEKALRNIDAPLILGVGFIGDRIDHELACYHALVAYSDRPCLLLGQSDIVFLAPPTLNLVLVPGTRVSLFPMSAVSGRSIGLQWPIEGLAFDPATKIGTSNIATGSVTLSWENPGMLVILPRECLQAAVKALLAQPGSWSAL